MCRFGTAAWLACWEILEGQRGGAQDSVQKSVAWPWGTGLGGNGEFPGEQNEASGLDG